MKWPLALTCGRLYIERRVLINLIHRCKLVRPSCVLLLVLLILSHPKTWDCCLFPTHKQCGGQQGYRTSTVTLTKDLRRIFAECAGVVQVPLNMHIYLVMLIPTVSFWAQLPGIILLGQQSSYTSRKLYQTFRWHYHQWNVQYKTEAQDNIYKKYRKLNKQGYRGMQKLRDRGLPEKDRYKREHQGCHM